MTNSWKKYLVNHFLRPTFEAIGIDRFSKVALGELNEKLLSYFNYRDGFFIELGANDGRSQSNTYYLEKFLGWKGVLIEPIPRLYEQAVKARPNSRVFNNACVPFDFSDDTISVVDAGLMSIVKDSLNDDSAESAHLQTAKSFMTDTELKEVHVATRTLNSILEECDVQQIDFLSLDVEGYEVSVLQGLDLEQFRPQYMLIESFERHGVSTRAEIDAIISDWYEPIEKMSYHDVLYRRKENK